VVNSNRQRGMKNGRFQNNVGHRESWHWWNYKKKQSTED
jgi:hypothetical protein